MLTLIVWLVIGTFCTGAVAAAVLDERRAAATSATSETWTAIQNRNGVTAPIPFASPDASINQPGLVQVYPRTQKSAPHPVPVSNAPLRHPAPLEAPSIVQSEPEESSERSEETFAKKETPLKWGYPQGGYSIESQLSEGLAVVKRLISEGERRKTALSWAAFGATGGAVYLSARPHIEEALSNAE